MNTDPIFVHVHCSTREEATRVADALLERRLVACASIGAPVASRYWWESKLDEAQEVPLTLKTIRANFAAVESVVRSLHSYTTPEIVAFAAAEISSDYADWLVEAVHDPIPRP
ncbi:MAG TPA: divalent-cation tolerance protein CutA [Terriglobales bacterium]|nr:divalent-cation tolerance protein CutA [Terriglobales bacterium]